MGKLIDFWTKRNEEFLEEARYTSWTYKKLIDKHLKDVKGKKAIELGYGSGIILNHLKNKEAITEGLELCKDAIDKYKDDTSVKVIHGDCRNVPLPDDSYDLVMSFGVIEHFKEWRESIKEHFRICKPGGKVLIAVPYVYSPVYYIMLGYYLKDILKYGRVVVCGKPFRKNEFKKEMGKYGKVGVLKAFDFCCILEGLTKKKHFKFASFLERCFGFMGVMLFCLVEKKHPDN